MYADVWPVRRFTKRCGPQAHRVRRRQGL